MNKEQFIGRTLIGGYTVEKILGDGTFGFACLARFTHDNSLVAVKLFKPIGDVDQIPSMRNEARFLGHLRHPNIVPFYWYDVEPVHLRDEQNKQILEEYPFIVMKYANSGSLRERIDQKGRLPTEQAVDYLLQTANGVQHAHDKKILHRDLKPANLLLHRHPGHDHLDVLVSDFGIAIKAHSETSLHMATTQIAIGTPAYMAPEQFIAEAEPASDLYSLGVIAYELLTGKRPFTAHNNIGYQLAHTFNTPPSFREKWGDEIPKVVEALEEAVMKALAKKPQERHSSVGNFAQTLKEAHRKAVENEEKQRRVFEGAELQRKGILPQQKSEITPLLPIVEALMIGGVNFLEQGRYEEAIQLIDHAIQLDLNDQLARNTILVKRISSYEPVWLWFNKALSDPKKYDPDPTNDGQLLPYPESAVLRQLSKYNSVIDDYNYAIRTLELDPNNKDAWARKGGALEALGGYEEALAAYEQVIHLDPTDFLAWMSIAGALNKLKRHEEAIQIYDRLLAFDPEDSSRTILCNKGIALCGLKRYEEALGAYKKAQELVGRFRLSAHACDRALDRPER